MKTNKHEHTFSLQTGMCTCGETFDYYGMLKKLKVKSDDKAKLKALKRLLKEFDDKIQDKDWDYFYLIANNIINNHNYKKVG